MRIQYENFMTKLWQGVENKQTDVSKDKRSLMFLCYMANQNSFLELSDKFNVYQSKAHEIIFQVKQCVVNIARNIIRWPTNCEKPVLKCSTGVQGCKMSLGP